MKQIVTGRTTLARKLNCPENPGLFRCRAILSCGTFATATRVKGVNFVAALKILFTHKCNMPLDLVGLLIH
jgi:hypothetical protein